MAVAPLRRRAGKIEIDLKEKRLNEQLKLREEKPVEPISEEEHNRRLEMLRSMGLIGD